MAETKEKRRRAQWLAKYPWYEHFRCCDHQYELDDDQWGEDDVAWLKEQLLARSRDLIQDYPVYLAHHSVGRLRIDLRRVFDEVCDTLRYQRIASDGSDRRLTDEEVAAPLTSEELTSAVRQVGRFWSELIHYSHLPDDIMRDADAATELNAGAASTLGYFHRTVFDIEDLRSRRLLRALSAIAQSTWWRREFASPGVSQSWKDEVSSENSEVLQPLDASGRSLLRHIRKLLEGARGYCQSPYPVGPRGGRPRKAPPPEDLRRRFHEARRFLGDFRRRAKALTRSASAGRRMLATEFPAVFTRIERWGLDEAWLRDAPFDVPLDEMAADLVAAECDPPLSANTVREVCAEQGVQYQGAAPERLTCNRGRAM
jgi:hypothetical protein